MKHTLNIQIYHLENGIAEMLDGFGNVVHWKLHGTIVKALVQVKKDERVIASGHHEFKLHRVYTSHKEVENKIYRIAKEIYRDDKEEIE